MNKNTKKVNKKHKKSLFAKLNKLGEVKWFNQYFKGKVF